MSKDKLLEKLTKLPDPGTIQMFQEPPVKVIQESPSYHDFGQEPEPPSVASFMPGGSQDWKQEPKPQEPKPQDTMHVTALVFLDDPNARRLAVAWVSCQGNEEKWLEVAGLTGSTMYSEAQRLMIVLKQNRICRDGGITDELAMKYIAGYIKEQMGKRGK